jgi:hypothetical protein
MESYPSPDLGEVEAPARKSEWEMHPSKSRRISTF